MTFVKYTGAADVRELASADLQKAGVEGFSKTQFLKGKAQNVSEEVAIALTARDDLFGKFELVTLESPKSDDADSKTVTEKTPAKK